MKNAPPFTNPRFYQYFQLLSFRNPYTIHLGPTKESLLDGLFSIIQRLRENDPDFDQEDEV